MGMSGHDYHIKFQMTVKSSQIWMNGAQQVSPVVTYDPHTLDG